MSLLPAVTKFRNGHYAQFSECISSNVLERTGHVTVPNRGHNSAKLPFQKWINGVTCSYHKIP